MNQSRLRNIAVILAGGRGVRMGAGLPKQFIKIAGRPVIEHTIIALQSSTEIDEIMILTTPGFMSETKKIVEAGHYSKVTKVLEGGETRNDTTRIALGALGKEECNVLFHDAVRPLLSHRIIRQCVNALKDYEAVDVAIASADTIIEVAEQDTIKDIPDRSRLRRGQTPQGFRLSTIRKAYQIAKDDADFKATDDCGVVLTYLPEVPIAVVEGSEQNIKITHPIDTFLADRLFQLSSATGQQRLSQAERAEGLSGRTLVVFGGSYGIGERIAKIAQNCGADVFSFSRSSTGTHVENEKDVKTALETAHQKTGRIDHIVNTAGLLKIGPLAEADSKTVEEMISINYVAPVTIAKAGLPYLNETSGHLLLFTSSSYTRGRADYSLYSSSKAAVVNLTQALADEWAEQGVKINCVNPERTDTPMRRRAFGAEDPRTLLTAEAVAESSIDILLSELTGQVIDVRRSEGELPNVNTALSDEEEKITEASKS